VELATVLVLPVFVVVVALLLVGVVEDVDAEVGLFIVVVEVLAALDL